ncbi:terminase family protein [uncultured Roseibium sp.]|uniref:DNA-packaging protein n=1 Tax=uncultured Roseibium sp. TaxID=1936171 RepID=UPI00260F1394|nr:terminase family protein [uncultured Roseibium sp.]
MLSPAERLGSLSQEDREVALADLSEEDCEELLFDWRGFLARPNQIAPDGDWDIWMVLAGRGFGKTRIGAEWVKEQVASGISRIALIGETAADTRDVMVEGESGLLSVYPKSERPLYESSKRQVTWPNGAIAKLYNATEPDQLRGPQHEIAWSDELAKWRYARETWDQLQFGLRLGDHPKQIVTTTPRPIELVKAIVAGQEGAVAVTRGRTLDNKSNLAPAFLKKIQKKYEGTRLGRQELHAEILGDRPGAIWRQADLDASRLTEAPDDIERILVAVDPATTNNEDSNDHGIVVVGMRGDTGFVIEDGSTEGSPLQWARRAVALHDKHQADGIVVETNQGGDMVAHTLRGVRDTLNIIEVRASRGKHVRAEPIAAIYETGRVHHIGAFPELETQMTDMTNAGYEGDGSPDRVDALVWGFSELFPDLIKPNKQPRKAAPRSVTSWMG